MTRKRIQFGGPSRSRTRTATPQEPVEVSVDNLSLEGRGVARVDGKTLFIDGVLPGERAQVRITQRHKRYDEAEPVQLLESSAERQQPPCRYYGQCGGCQLQHLAPTAQLAHKEALVLDQLKRFAEIEPEQVEPALPSPDLGYRRSARIGINQRADGTPLIGFRRAASHKLIDIDHCPVLEPRINALLAELRLALLAWEGSLKHLTHADISAGDDCGVLTLRITRTLQPALAQRIAAICAEHRFQLVLEGNQGLEPVDTGAPALTYSLPPMPLQLGFGAGDFLQVNATVNRAMVARARDWLAPTGEDRVLDLFCGLGNFTLPLALHAGEVIGVEGSSAMVERALANAAANGLENVQVFKSDLSGDIRDTSWYQHGRREGFDLILLDPPRTGAQEAVRHLVHYNARRILYVACNPAALVRDARTLADAGYRLSRFCVMDMFPHTAHIESMALFEC